MNFLDDISQLSQELGFVDFGIAEACALSREQEQLAAYLHAGHHGRMGYLERNPAQRCDPSLLVADAASVWIFLAPYLPAPPSPAFARIAGYAQGKDYHLLIKERLYQLLQRIQTHFPQTQGRAFTDSAPLLERSWAVRCGLGFIGRNGLLIHPQYGSRVLIGALVLNTPIDALLDALPQKSLTAQKIFRKDDLPQLKDARNRSLGCGHCNLCLKNCPGQALVAPYCLDARKCIAYRTLEEPAMIKAEAKRQGAPIPARAGVKRPLTGWLYGCDACQEICPWNKKALQQGWPELHCYQETLSNLQRSDWEQMDEITFKSRFPDSPLLRCGLPNLSDESL